MGGLGVPEIVIVVLGLVFWLVPIAAGVWAMITLHRIRTTLEVMSEKVSAIEQRGQRL